MGDEKVKKLNHKKSFDYLNKREKKIIRAFVKELREKFGENILSIRLFGSKVRGDFAKDSDIDVLLVFQVKSVKVRDKVYDILFGIDPDYELKISPGIMSLYEYQKNEELHSPFIENVEKEGIKL
ncbi:MAG: nucleotidyltransferase domain-containing protein [bacterium]